VATDPSGDSAAGGAGSAGGATTISGGAPRTTRPSPARPGAEESGTVTDGTPDPNWFDASGLGGLLGVGTGTPQTPADAAAGDSPSTELESALPSRGDSAPSSPVLLALSLLILLALAGGLAYRWWDRRESRYWPA
jgi:hypothetical protein